MTTVAAISDTHLPRGARRLPEHCLEQLRAVELILHAGDLTSVAFLEELQSLGPPVHAVRGNVDEPALQALLPEIEIVEVGGVRIGMRHIPEPDAQLLARFPGCGAVLFGHTHRPVVERRGHTWLLNPGSPTERRRAPFHSMLLLEVVGGRIRPELLRLS